jgi:FkbM family methyltransferase
LKKINLIKNIIMKRFIELPRDHFVHLKELAFARKEELYETAIFLMNFGRSSDENWLPGRYGGDATEKHKVVFDKGSQVVNTAELMKAIQALPNWIKSKTDGAISDDYSFQFFEDGAPAITKRGRTFYDLTPVGNRERVLYEYLQDTFPFSLSLEQFQILSFCQSQYSTLLDEPERYVMPGEGELSVDAGSFIGYKATAMADLVGPTGKVYAIELDKLNYQLQEKSISKNGLESIISTVNCALSDQEGEMTVMTRAKGSMGHSLTDFDGFGDNLNHSIVQTRRLDNVFTELGIDYIDSLHVSVNGHELQVLEGLGDYVSKVGVFCVMAPYSVNGVNVRQTVVEYFERNNIQVWGRSQAAVVAGPNAGKFPIQPI